jgi:acetyltransferase-like isoleucine patch superfamily enzyme
MKAFAEKIISRLKNQPNYKIEGDYSSRELMMIFYYRLFQILRGFKYKLRMKSEGLVFAGRRVKIEHAYRIKAGKSLILEDGVYVNAFSDKGIQLGDNVNLGRNSIVICSGVIANKGIGIKIGNNSAIGPQGFLGGQGGITIGDDVICGPGVRIFSENHNFNNPDISIKLQGENRKGVHIGNNCWIGSGVTILDGVTIGNGCVIAAGSLITKSIADNKVFYLKTNKQEKNRVNANTNRIEK